MNNNKLQSNILWQPQDVDFVFRSYQIFEKKFLDILKFLPLAKENEKSWSPELVNLFLDTSSLFDSISRHIVGLGKDKDESVEVNDASGASASKKVGDLDINDFERNLFLHIDLLNSRVVVYSYPLKIISPYQNYRSSNGWWKIYNLLKHNRIVNYNKANLVSTLNALAALFLLLVRYKEEEFTKALLRLELLETDYVPEYVHSARINEGYQFWYDSELFGTHELPQNIPSDDITQIQSITASRKFHIFIGHFNP